MNDESDIPSDSSTRKSYRVCTACGCHYHSSRECCPECGAYPGELHAPSADIKLSLTLSLLLGLILLIALFTLSRERDQAARLEAEKFKRIPVTTGEPSEAAPVAVTPTPVPLATATPIPTPVPTPIPFTPEDFIPAPPPTPLPAATPVPQQVAPPTPVPQPTRSSTLDLKDQLADQFRKELDEKMPMAKVGDFVRLTLRDNRGISGTITRLDANQLSIQSSSGARWISFRQLSRESRMQVDRGERETWAEEKALQEVLQRLQN